MTQPHNPLHYCPHCGMPIPRNFAGHRFLIPEPILTKWKAALDIGDHLPKDLAQFLYKITNYMRPMPPEEKP